MASLTFPCRPHDPSMAGGWNPGTPDRAMHCRCHGGPRIPPKSDTCLLCGHYPLITISETWRQRAAIIAMTGRPPRRRARTRR